MKRIQGCILGGSMLFFVLFFSSTLLIYAQANEKSLIHKNLIPSLTSERFLANTTVKRNGVVVNPLKIKEKTNWNERDFEIVFDSDSVKWVLKDSENQTYQIIFPNDYALYFGKDKKNLQEELLGNLRKAPQMDLKSGTPTKSGTVINNVTGTKYGIFFNQYFTNHRNENVFSKELVAESLVNSFVLQDQPHFFAPLNLKFHKYGSEVEDFEIYPKSLKEALIGEEEYTLRSSIEDDVLILLFEHPFLNFHHMLFVKNQKAGFSITADLYSYIPNSNIQELYSEFRKSKDSIKVILQN
jgi:hypothetical protein